jgi:hypothetical protein
VAATAQGATGNYAADAASLPARRAGGGAFKKIWLNILEILEILNKNIILYILILYLNDYENDIL